MIRDIVDVLKKNLENNSSKIQTTPIKALEKSVVSELLLQNMCASMK